MAAGPLLVVTTVVRRAPLGAPSGYVWVLDSDRRTVALRSPVPDSLYRAQDPNPRGGLRGGRGVAVWQDRLVIANTERLFVFNSAWRLVREISHPLMGGVHDVLAEEDGIWVTCTYSDLLIKVDWSGNLIDEWEWRRDANLTHALGLDRVPPIDGGIDYRNPDAVRKQVWNTIHLNAVNYGREGMLLSFGRVLSPAGYRRKRLDSAFSRLAQDLGMRELSRKSASRALERLRLSFSTPEPDNACSAIVLLKPDRTTRVLRRVTRVSEPNHNICQVGDAIVYNDTNRHLVVRFSDDGGEEVHVNISGERPFVRGLVHVRDQVFLAGSQAPLALYEVDLAAGRLISTWKLDPGPDESIYGICRLTSVFDKPPASLFPVQA